MNYDFFYYYVFKCDYFKQKGQVLRCFITKGDDLIHGSSIQRQYLISFQLAQKLWSRFFRTSITQEKNCVRNNEFFIRETRQVRTSLEVFSDRNIEEGKRT